MAFIYENGQETKQPRANSRRNRNNSPLNRKTSQSRTETRKKEDDSVRDCVIGLCLIKKGVRVVNQEVLKKYYK